MSKYTTTEEFFEPKRINLHKLYIHNLEEVRSADLIDMINDTLDELCESNPFFSTLNRDSLDLDAKMSAINGVGFCVLFSSSKKNCVSFKAALVSKLDTLQDKIQIVTENT